MTDAIDRDLERLFDREIMPLAARLKGEGIRFMETQLEKEALTYFVSRTNVEMTKANFESGGCTSPDGVEADLLRLWNRGKNDSLAGLAPEMARLARSLRQVEEETGDVSNFIYVMY